MSVLVRNVRNCFFKSLSLYHVQNWIPSFYFCVKYWKQIAASESTDKEISFEFLGFLRRNQSQNYILQTKIVPCESSAEEVSFE